jgi:hypothetical protein
MGCPKPKCGKVTPPDLLVRTIELGELSKASQLACRFSVFVGFGSSGFLLEVVGTSETATRKNATRPLSPPGAGPFRYAGA